MIVVVGVPCWRPTEPPGPSGRACEVALAATAAGAHAEVVGRVGDDPAGDLLIIELARAGVGHAASLRDPALPTPIQLPAAEDDAEHPFADPTPSPSAAPTAAPAQGPRLEAADVSLALSYLTSYSVLVVTDDAPVDVLPACVAGAEFAGARLVVLVPGGVPAPAGLPDDATLIEAPGNDDGAFARLVGSYAASLEAGTDPATAFTAALAGSWERPAADDAGRRGARAARPVG